jgi:hypothetical protein
MKAQTILHEHAFASTSADEAYCSEQGGMLEAVRLMAEKKKTRVLMLNSEQTPVGVVEAGPQGIVYRSLNSAMGS